MTINEFIEKWSPAVKENLPDEDARLILEILICDILEIPFQYGNLNGSIEISNSDSSILSKGVKKVIEGVPVQYVTGISWFLGLKFKINRHVLIPRPETEELIDYILIKESDSKTPVIIDFGCGSGCIPVSVAKFLPGSKVYAIDISAPALELTTENALLNGVELNIINMDILAGIPAMDEKIDIIISNPPYIEPDEKSQIDMNVLDNEPHLALFTPVGNPLIFYRQILQFASQSLSDTGSIYFEMNPHYVDELTKLTREMGYKQIEFKEDITGKLRFCIIGR